MPPSPPIVDGEYLYRFRSLLDGVRVNMQRHATVVNGLVHAKWLGEPVPAETLRGEWTGPLPPGDSRIQRAAADPLGRLLEG
jgi:hypothetical protein